MCLAVKPQQMGLVDAGIALCGRQAGMAKKFLNGAKIGTMAQQMCGKGVTQRVRRDMRQAELEAKRFNTGRRVRRSCWPAADKQR